MLETKKKVDFGEIPKEIYALFEADEYCKFKEMLKLVLST